jgi:hypothetical protein
MFKEIDADKSGHLDRGEILELAKAMDTDPDGDGGAEIAFVGPCYAKDDYFAKTGSGQT